MRQNSEIQYLAERRRFPRYICMGNVEILQNGRLWGWGQVDEISRCGCYINTTHPLPSGTWTQLRLTVAGTSLNVAANVVCTTPQVGMGMDFVVETPEQRNKLAQIVEEVKATLLLEPPAMLQAGAYPAGANHLQAALSHLQQAHEGLQDVMPDEAGHRARALQLTENAIHEVRKAQMWRSRMGTMVPASIMNGLSCEVQ